MDNQYMKLKMDMFDMDSVDMVGASVFSFLLSM